LLMFRGAIVILWCLANDLETVVVGLRHAARLQTVQWLVDEHVEARGNDVSMGPGTSSIRRFVQGRAEASDAPSGNGTRRRNA
ncbi:MAG: hypothetical protein ACKPKO_00105, partial [Candidatus Fonsibacter sp.]